jgi:hypothetical protein
MSCCLHYTSNSFDSLSVTQFNHATLIAWSYVCVLVLSTLSLFIKFSDYIWELLMTVWYFFFTLLYRSTWVLRTLVTFSIAQCGFLGSITKVIAIEERTKDWSNRECQTKYSRTVKLKVKCLKSLEKEPKCSLSKHYKRIQ